jgi:hypothetical protein
MSEYARKTIIDYCGIALEVYMLPDGSYTLSQSQVGKAIDEPEYSPRRFLKGKAAESIHNMVSNLGTVLVENGQVSIKSIPIKVALAYWNYKAKKGNTKAQALLMTGTEEVITRLADQAFGVAKADIQYAAERNENYQVNQQILAMLQELMQQNKSVLLEMGAIKATLSRQEKELVLLRPVAEEFAKITPALNDLKELKPLLEQISDELKRNPNQQTEKLAVWLKHLGINHLSNGQRMSLGRIISGFLKVGNLTAPMRSNCNYYPESMLPLINLATKYLV